MIFAFRKVRVSTLSGGVARQVVEKGSRTVRPATKPLFFQHTAAARASRRPSRGVSRQPPRGPPHPVIICRLARISRALRVAGMSLVCRSAHQAANASSLIDACLVAWATLASGWKLGKIDRASELAAHSTRGLRMGIDVEDIRYRLDQSFGIRLEFADFQEVCDSSHPFAAVHWVGFSSTPPVSRAGTV
jgi:hypothetical protein